MGTLCAKEDDAQGLPTSVFKCQYQSWNPNVHLVDNDNQEPLIRVLGGLIGVVIAYSYNKILVATRDNKDDEGFYYRLVWGREPVVDEKDAKSSTSYQSDRKYTRYGGAGSGGGGKYSKMAMIVSPTTQQEGYDPAADCDMHTICVTQTRCRKHPDGGAGCSAECKNSNSEAVSGSNGGGGGGWGSNFKLRIPYTLDYVK